VPTSRRPRAAQTAPKRQSLAAMAPSAQLDKVPELGTKPVTLTVKLPPFKHQVDDHLGDGLRELYRRGELTDVSLMCAEQAFNAHKVVLAASSEVFKEGLAKEKEGLLAEGGGASKREVRLADVYNPESVKFMLDYIYQVDDAELGKFNPRTQEINKDILTLAQNFRLPGLTERATHWLAKDLHTGNVVERLTICETFGLNVLRERILEQLTTNKKALAEVASSPQIMKYPKLMQGLLQQAALATESPQPNPKKKAKKA